MIGKCLKRKSKVYAVKRKCVFKNKYMPAQMKERKNPNTVRESKMARLECQERHMSRDRGERNRLLIYHESPSPHIRKAALVPWMCDEGVWKPTLKDID